MMDLGHNLPPAGGAITLRLNEQHAVTIERRDALLAAGELRGLANRIDAELDAIRDDPAIAAGALGAVNWGDLSVCVIARRTPISTVAVMPPDPPYVAMIIAEADPACRLVEALRERMDIPEDVVIECEW